MADDGDLTATAVGFARTLRAAGVNATPDRVHAFVQALEVLRVERRSDVYWAGRATLCAGPDDLARYDRVFAAYFAGVAASTPPRVRRDMRIHRAGIAATDGGDEDSGEEVTAGLRLASAVERLRHRDVSTLGEQERAELNRLLATFALPGDLRRTRRWQAAHSGPVDRRRTVRALLAAGGEPGALRRREPRSRPRRVVLLVDVSGSMSGYADALLRFAHAATRRHAGATEVFSLGTRLTRITGSMAHRDPELAMHAVSDAIPDWSGGTRLGATLKEFLDVWGQRGTARGAVVVVLSDGWETGDVSLLGTQMARLHRLAHRVVWANPRAGQAGFTPTARGMAVALPHCDQLVQGHSLAALERLAMIVRGAIRGRGSTPQGIRSSVAAGVADADQDNPFGG